MADTTGNKDTPNTTHHLAENCVEYFIFVDDRGNDDQSLLSRLEFTRKAAVQISQSLTKDYVWQRGEFQLELETGQGLAYLHGITDYGDAVEDEWLIVYMLRELTKTHPNTWVRVADADGEFLLVEAAAVLPSWLNPEMDENRVWLHDGRLLIIPSTMPGSVNPPASHNLSLSQAVEFFKENADALVHSTFIEEEAFYRLTKYPGQVGDSIHCSVITIPRKVAFILHSLPKTVAPAVEAFYLRDPIGLKPILSSSDPLFFAPDDLVTTSVRFSKVLFAQLKSQQFEAPPRWKLAIQRLQNSPPSSSITDKDITRLDIGMKLTCGFEMLAANAEKSQVRVVRELAIVLEDIEEDKGRSLPIDDEIAAWKHSDRDDDETWMDINYEDFERELEGKSSRKSSKEKRGFGDAQTHTDLQKIVSRFESFLNDKGAGIDGAELDSMDVDDDVSSDEGTNDDAEEDKEVSFDEAAFSNMMREMMGLPSGEDQRPLGGKDRSNLKQSQRNDGGGRKTGDGAEVKTVEDDEIKNLSAQMEAELHEHGALRMDAKPSRPRELANAANEKSSPTSDKWKRTAEDQEEESDSEVDIDFNLAKNLLESFKSQAGMAGPAGNLLGLMGLQLPRDEVGDGDDNSQHDGDDKR